MGEEKRKNGSVGRREKHQPGGRCTTASTHMRMMEQQNAVNAFQNVPLYALCSSFALGVQSVVVFPSPTSGRQCVFEGAISLSPSRVGVAYKI